MQEQLPRRVKSSSYIPRIPTFSLWRRSRRTCVDTYALEGMVSVDIEIIYLKMCSLNFYEEKPLSCSDKSPKWKTWFSTKTEMENFKADRF
jgi:hypothetical protein